MHKCKEDEAARIRKEVALDHDGEVVIMSLVKNNLGLRRDPITYVRMPDGVLFDVSLLLAKRLSPEESLLQVVREANNAGRKLSKTGPSGLYANKTKDWPGGLYNMSRKDIEGIANLQIERGALISTPSGLAVAEKGAEICQ